MRGILVIAVCVWVAANTAVADILLQAEPQKRFEVGSNGIAESALSAAQRRENQLIIEADDGRFYWVTRGGVELVYRSSGLYDIFIATTGAGYIKVERSFVGDGEVAFLEHVHLGLVTITYFGSTDAYRPELLQ